MLQGLGLRQLTGCRTTPHVSGFRVVCQWTGLPTTPILAGLRLCQVTGYPTIPIISDLGLSTDWFSTTPIVKYIVYIA